MISLTAFLSINLGIFNLLPIPALDGSRLLFLGIEAIRGRPVDPNRESMVHFIGFAMLMLLMIAVTYNDIVRLIQG
ncbi:Regulator of sigma-W protease RasP [compost metagenome]